MEAKIIDRYRNKIITGNVLEEIKQIPDNSIDCVITSPPYWALRDYKIESVVWDGDSECEHEWQTEEKKDPMDRNGYGIHDAPKENKKIKHAKKWEMEKHRTGFCCKCGAWLGQLGLEPTIELYIQHLIQIFDEIKRVLRPTGTCWVNLGDVYASSPAGNKETINQGDGVYSRLMKRHTNGGESSITPKPKQYEVPIKSLCLLPFRFATEMVNRGWILRNTLIWHKLNALPSSVKDRFTVDFEYIFFFVKSNKPQYWVNTRTGEITNRKPKGINGEEGKDWEWQDCPRCKYGVNWREQEERGYEIGALDPHRAALRGGLALKRSDPSQIAIEHGYDPEGICPVCGRTWKRHASPNAKDRQNGIRREFMPCVQISQEQDEQLNNLKMQELSYSFNYRTSYAYRKGDNCPQFRLSDSEKEYAEKGICHRCKGTGKVKRPLWTGKDYYFKQQKEPIKESTIIRSLRKTNKNKSSNGEYGGLNLDNQIKLKSKIINNEINGRNMRSVWSISTQPFKGSHFAVFPPRLIEPIIKAGCPERICNECELPLETIIKKEYVGASMYRGAHVVGDGEDTQGGIYNIPRENAFEKTIGQSSCGHDNYAKGIVLDPFMGSGTVAVVAKQLGRDYIGIEANPEYVKMAEQRLKEIGENLF